MNRDEISRSTGESARDELRDKLGVEVGADEELVVLIGGPMASS